jgi:agmatinase
MDSGLADPKNVIWLGVGRLLRKKLFEYVTRSGASYISVTRLRELGVDRAIGTAIDRALDGADVLYVTIDIDVVDATFAPGTGAIGFGGLSPMELLEIVRVLAPAPVGAIDLVEVCPQWDPTGVTERLAAVALTTFLGLA